MKIRLVGIIVLITVCQIAYSQSDSLRQTPHYYNSFFSGALIGCGDCNSGKDFSLSFVTMHGLAFDSGIKLSAGLGMDVYTDWRLFPMLIGFTIDKEEKPNALYLHINAGYSVGRYLKVSPWEQGDLTQRGGLTINPMIGYRIGNEKVRLYIQAGYKYQHAYYKLDYANFGYPYSNSREYEISRVVMQMGFGFN